MGQAVADLPDPLDTLLSPGASASGTDDLLSQLAGDEIDRLLAEAESDQQQAPPVQQPAAPAPVVAVAPPPVAPAPAPVEAVAPAPAAPAVAAVPAPTAPARAPVAADDDELDALLNELSEGVPPVNQPAVAASAPQPAPVAAAAPVPQHEDEEPARAKSLTEQVPEVLAQFGGTVAPPSDAIPTVGDKPAPAAAASAPAASDNLMSAAERDALKINDLAAEADAVERKDAAAALSADKPPSRLAAPAIKVLELVNAPAAFLPDNLRDTLGKVAILTLVNSIAVLIYVLFVRH